MSLHYLLDGYNIIHQMPVFDRLKLEDQRSALVRYLEQVRPQGSIKNKVTVVFDGKTGMLSHLHSAVVTVIFSQENSADDRIREIVEESKNAKNIVVITNDRGLQHSVRLSGARINSVEEFLREKARHTNDGKDKDQRSSLGAGKNISHTTGYKITSEMEKIWLKKKN